MSKKKNLCLVSMLCFIFIIAGYGISQSLSEIKSSVKEESTVSWQDKNLGVTESQGVEFKEDTMVVTNKSVFKNGDEVLQVARIPAKILDPSRLDSFPHQEIEGMYYLNIFSKNDEKNIKVATSYGKDSEDNIVYTHFFTLYSKDKEQGKALKEKIEQLIYLLGG